MKTQEKIRHYDLDWLRVIAIIILLFFHTGMFFNVWGWHVKNAEQSQLMSNIMVWFHEWRMPLLLFISGAGTFFALGFRSPGKFIKERSKRLMIPLLFGMFVIVPPQIYFEYIEKFANYFEFYPTVFEFRPYPGGSFSWHHLWFILYLFLYSVICLPLFKYFRNEKSLNLRNKIAKLISKPGGFSYFLIPIIVIQFIVRPFFPRETHDLTDLGHFLNFMLYFLLGYIIYSDARIWSAIKTNRNVNLIISLIFVVITYVIYFARIDISLGGYYFLYHVPATIMTWHFILAVIGYGQKYLNKKSKTLTDMNIAIYPFYILHQSVMIIIGYYIIQWELGILSKYIIINALTAVACVGTYQLFIKPFNLMRLFFGMKPKKIVSYEETKKSVILASQEQ